MSSVVDCHAVMCRCNQAHRVLGATHHSIHLRLIEARDPGRRRRATLRTMGTRTHARCAAWAATCCAVMAVRQRTTCAASGRGPSPSQMASGSALSAPSVAEVRSPVDALFSAVHHRNRICSAHLARSLRAQPHLDNSIRWDSHCREPLLWQTTNRLCGHRLGLTATALQLSRAANHPFPLWHFAGEAAGLRVPDLGTNGARQPHVAAYNLLFHSALPAFSDKGGALAVEHPDVVRTPADISLALCSFHT